MQNIYLNIMNGYVEISKSPMLCEFDVREKELSAHW